MRSIKTLLTACLLTISFAIVCDASTLVDGNWQTTWLDPKLGYFHKFGREFSREMMIARTSVLIGMPSRRMYYFELESHFRYQLGALIRPMFNGDLYQMDLASEKVLVIPRSESAAGLFWQTQECGILEWRVNVATDVSGKLCKQTGNPGQKWFTKNSYRSYETVYVQGDKIQVGDIEADPNRNGTSPEKRPNALESFVFYRQ